MATQPACRHGRLRGTRCGHACVPRPAARRPADQADSRARPLRRRPARMARPARVRIRSRNPWVFARRRLFGWNVRLLTEELPTQDPHHLVAVGGEIERQADAAQEAATPYVTGGPGPRSNRPPDRVSAAVNPTRRTLTTDSGAVVEKCLLAL